jgi:hypothetical protein
MGIYALLGESKIAATVIDRLSSPFKLKNFM